MTNADKFKEFRAMMANKEMLTAFSLHAGAATLIMNTFGFRRTIAVWLSEIHSALLQMEEIEQHPEMSDLSKFASGDLWTVTYTLAYEIVSRLPPSLDSPSLMLEQFRKLGADKFVEWLTGELERIAKLSTDSPEA